MSCRFLWTKESISRLEVSHSLLLKGAQETGKEGPPFPTTSGPTKFRTDPLTDPSSPVLRDKYTETAFLRLRSTRQLLEGGIQLPLDLGPSFILHTNPKARSEETNLRLDNMANGREGRGGVGEEAGFPGTLIKSTL